MFPDPEEGAFGRSGLPGRRLYRVRSQPLREIDDWLEPYRALWTESLDALERHLDDMPDDEGAR